MQRAVWPISHFGPFVMYFFGVRELAPAFSTADSSAVCLTPRPVVAYKSGDESPHSKRRVRITALRSATTSNLRRRMVPDFGVRELAPALSTADSSAVGVAPRRVAASKSGDESPHSESFGLPHHTACSSTIGRSTGEFCFADWYMASAHSSVARTLASVIIGSHPASMARTMSSMTA